MKKLRVGVIGVGSLGRHHARLYKELEDVELTAIVDIKEDPDGVYFVTKGDNNNAVDPQKVRFSQIKGVVVAVLY